MTSKVVFCRQKKALGSDRICFELIIFFFLVLAYRDEAHGKAHKGTKMGHVIEMGNYLGVLNALLYWEESFLMHDYEFFYLCTWVFFVDTTHTYKAACLQSFYATLCIYPNP